jgi:hypothetical protein
MLPTIYKLSFWSLHYCWFLCVTMERFILASSWQILNKHTKFRLWCDITLRNPFSQKQIKDCIYLYFKFVKWSNLLINYNTNNITMFTSVSDNISTNYNLFIFSWFSCWICYYSLLACLILIHKLLPCRTHDYNHYKSPLAFICFI